MSRSNRPASVILAGAGVLLVALFCVWPAPRASAHAGLGDTSPRASSVLEGPPVEIVLDFDEAVEPGLGEVVLLDEDGREVVLEEATSTGDATQVVVPITSPSDMGLGVYVVVYRVTSNDSHVVAGSFSFQIGSGEADQQSVLNRVMAGRDAANSSAIGWTLGVLRFLSFAGVVVLLGGWALVALRNGVPPLGARPARLLWLGLVAGVLGTLGTFLLQGPRVLGRGFGGAADPAMWSDVAGTKYGKALLVRVLLFGLAVVPVLGIRLTHLRPWRMAAMVVGTCLLLTYGVSGQAGSGRLPGVGVLLDVVHLGAVGVWLGGVFMLAFGGPDWLDGEDGSPSTVRRFSRTATVCVGIVVATGVLQTWRIVRYSDVISGTTYGRTLVVKVAVVVLLVVLGGMALVALRQYGPQSLRALVMAECVVGLTVLGITAGLVAVPAEISSPVVPAVVTIAQGEVTATLTVTPARVGANDLHLTVVLPAAALEPSESATVRVSLPERGIDSGSIVMAAEGPDHYSAYSVQFPFAGSWQVDILVATTATEMVQMRVAVEVGSR